MFGLDFVSHWAWLTLGLALAAAEVVAPGLFLIWLAGAALLTGLIGWLHPMGVAMEVALFAALSLASVLLARRSLYGRSAAPRDPALNDRGARLIGKTVTVTRAIAGGQGRVRLGDGEWPATGLDADVGTQLRVVGCEGVMLEVEAADG